ncbi:MAG: AAA-like domain-containing protein [Candidatus Poribacteria bacterium]|nr:AAA-like domain-containing protein [Candidatus Poribacteria bacterium]
MRRFGTQGPVNPEQHYVVPRTAELTEFIKRVKEGRYIVIFAPRQTGKTTFFQRAVAALTAEDLIYFPIQLNFEIYVDCDRSEFYESLTKRICKEIERVFHERGEALNETLKHFLDNAQITNHLSMMEFFEQVQRFLKDGENYQKVVLIIDEFDGIPTSALKGFLHAFRHTYITHATLQCPHSLGIVGVKSIAQLDYDRSVSPFNIHDDFALPNFTLTQVQELFGQYTAEVGQAFAPEVIESIHKQTGGQPFLVNRFAQILTEEMDIPKTETLTMTHFSEGYELFLDERNTNIEHLLTNIRKDPRFQTLLMRIVSYEDSVSFNPDNDIINELATYGVITKGADRKCEIVNPIYLYRIVQAFKPIVNGLERDYFPEDTDGFQYLTSDGHIQMERLMDNFRDFIARAGFRILQVPETPQEFIGQHLLFAYLDQFVASVNGAMYMEVPTGRGRMDLIILHNQRKYIVETKIWRSDRLYTEGKQQLAAYLSTEGVTEGYYVVFDHREVPSPRTETEKIDGLTIRSYVIPVVPERPSRAVEQKV